MQKIAFQAHQAMTMRAPNSNPETWMDMTGLDFYWGFLKKFKLDENQVEVTHAIDSRKGGRFYGLITNAWGKEGEWEGFLVQEDFKERFKALTSSPDKNKVIKELEKLIPKVYPV